MDAPPVKRDSEGGISLKPNKKRRSDVKGTDYNKCIICQKGNKDKLYNVQLETWEKLKIAIQARQDSNAIRLDSDVCESDWLEVKKPKWHNKCRNVYINERSYKLAEQKRTAHIKNVENESCENPSDESSSSGRVTRLNVEHYKPKECCVICNKVWYRGKKPESLVSTKDSQETIVNQAKRLNRDDILLRVVGEGHDMIANDVCYHKPCMDNFKATRAPSSRSQSKTLHETAFETLVMELEISLFQNFEGFLVQTLRDRYRQILATLGVSTSERYRSITLKWKLMQHFGSRIALLDQSTGSGFICASSVPLGDALAMLRQLENENNFDKKQECLLRAAKYLKSDIKLCKVQTSKASSLEISPESASAIIPDSLFNFIASLLLDKDQLSGQENSIRMEVDDNTRDKILVIGQQVLQHIGGVVTPLAVGTAYHLYNQTRSKELITLNNRLGQGISYDRLQRQLTAKTASIMQQIDEDGAFVPDEMSTDPEKLQIFAMDNLDWSKKTLEGGSFHATTAIVIENCESNVPPNNPLVITSTGSKKTLETVSENTQTVCNLSSKDRQRARSLAHIPSVENLSTECDNSAEKIHLVWLLGCMLQANEQLSPMADEVSKSLPGFSAFCASLFDKKYASKIAYVPLNPKSPTDPAVVKEEMLQLMTTSQKLGNQWTVITGDQAVFELATVIKKKHKDLFSKVVLMLGGFHQAHNYLKAVLRIMRGSGAEELIAAAGLCQEGTARKIFGDKAAYYQSLHALRILNEAIWRMYWETFEEWLEGRDTASWKPHLQQLIEKLLSSRDGHLNSIMEASPYIASLQEQMSSFNQFLASKPTARYWLEFLDMSGILIRFLCYQREGNWKGYLSESAKMLPYLTAAGHFKYGQQSLPYYLQEMKQLEQIAPEVHNAFMSGSFVARRSDGQHNAVSPDMLLEQTYNADAKESSGLTGITSNSKACAKWVYTKAVTAQISSKLKDMLHLSPETENPHHEAGTAQVSRESELVINLMTAAETNPFTVDSNHLINIVTGEHALANVQHDLTHVQQIGLQALENSLHKEGKAQVVKLNTFFTQNQGKNCNQKAQTPGKSDEVTALLRMTQVIASGGSLDVQEYIGKHECSNYPPSLFNEDGTMRACGTKSGLVKAIKEDTGVSSCEMLPENDKAVAVVIDVMHWVRRLSFAKDDKFSAIALRYKQAILSEVPANAVAVHMCFDRYRSPSMKEATRQSRIGKQKPVKIYDVSDQYKAPDPSEFFACSTNKAQLLAYLCNKLCQDELQSSSPDSTKMYLGGGFSEETKSVMLQHGSVTAVPALESTHEEADTRIILHTLYSFQVDKVERVIVHSSDTDVIVLCIYYASTMLKDLPELWVKTATDNYLPIHDIAKALQPHRCLSLPFVHSLSGRDTTSSTFFTSKKGWLAASKKIPLDALANFGSDGNAILTEDVISQARELLVTVYTKTADMSDASLSEIRTQKFLTNKTTLLKLLPPTEDAFMQHLKRSALATFIDKTAHIAKPCIPSLDEYGWTVKQAELVPVPVTTALWPPEMSKSLSCGCRKGCSRNCACAKREVPCYLACKCRGSIESCSRAQYYHQIEDSSDSD